MNKVKTHLIASWLILGLVYTKGGRCCSFRSHDNIDSQIRLIKLNNFKSCEVPLTLGLNEDTKKMYIAGEKDTHDENVKDYDNVDYLFKKLEEQNIRVDLIKIHFNYPKKDQYASNETPESWSINVTGSFENFQKLYHDKVIEIAKRYKKYCNRICYK